MKRQGAIPKERWSEVQRRLDAIERSQHCRILFAVESGSRAWGFPSPDSDYDVRFVYARPAATVRVIGRLVEAKAEPGKWARGRVFQHSAG
jgi:predicted nucleotidyltransferase